MFYLPMPMKYVMIRNSRYGIQGVSLSPAKAIHLMGASEPMWVQAREGV
jgi:hypothetical protein